MTWHDAWHHFHPMICIPFGRRKRQLQPMECLLFLGTVSKKYRALKQRLIYDGYVYCFGLHIVYRGIILRDATSRRRLASASSRFFNRALLDPPPPGGDIMNFSSSRRCSVVQSCLWNIKSNNKKHVSFSLSCFILACSQILSLPGDKRHLCKLQPIKMSSFLCRVIFFRYFKGIKFRGSLHPRNINISRRLNFLDGQFQKICGFRGWEISRERILRLKIFLHKPLNSMPLPRFKLHGTNKISHV